jgi:hypothetical protein
MPALSRNQWLLGGGALIALIAVFFPWYGVSYSCSGPYCGGLNGGASTSGFYGWGILFFLAALVLVIFAAIRLFGGASVKLPALPMEDWMISLILVAVMIVSALLYFLTTNSGGSYSGVGGSVSAGVSWGWYVALIATIVAGVGAFLNKSAPQPATAPLNYGAPPPSAPPPPAPPVS